MNQRYIDRFHSIFGSNALVALNRFFSSSELYATDDARVEYADHMLWNMRFVYLRAKKDDPDVHSAH